MDYLTIDALTIRAAHGHYEHERRVEQEFVISLRVGMSAGKAAESDALTDTIDYDFLRKIVEEVFAGKTQYLLEALAEHIAERILSETSAREVTISIQKPAVWPSGIPGVQFTRGRSG
jgi:dihydroneopterin aldolase